MPRPGYVEVSVLPNPWHSIDHFGRPAAPCPKPRTPTTVGHQGYIGAEIVASAPEKLPLGHLGTPYQDTCWHFSKEPEKYLDSAEIDYYFMKALRTGEILPADEQTAKYAGLVDADHPFVPFAEAVEAERVKAAAKWKAATGSDLPTTDPFERPEPDAKPSPADVARAESMKAFEKSQPALFAKLMAAVNKSAAPTEN